MKLFNKAGEPRITSGEEALRAQFAAQDEARRLEDATASADRESELRTRTGSDFCSARGCKQETGVACAYLDRRDRRCPTAWCPEHRVVSHGDVHCPAHATLLDGTDNGFGVHARADMDNRVPMLVNWVTREMDEMLRGMVERVASELHEQVIVEPVRFVLFGVERIRTWERSWKVVSHHGVSLRIAVAVEEVHPDSVLGKMNSKIATKLPPPWNEELPFGPEPASPDEAEAVLESFRRSLFMGLARPVEQWLQVQLESAAGIQAGGPEVYRAGG